MADQDEEKTGADVIAKKAISIGLKLHVNDADMKKNLDPTLASITKKLNELSKASDLKSGIFGQNFFTDKVKAFTGLDLTLVKATQNMIAYGRASKEMDTDGGKFYDSLNMAQKLMVKLSSGIKKRTEAQQEAATMTDALSKAEMVASATTESLDVALTDMGTAGAEAAAEATGGLSILISLLVLAATAAGKVFYQVFSAALTARNEAKKFDQIFSGAGSDGISKITSDLNNLNKQVWGLGFAIDKVNEVAFNATQQGLNFSRVLESNLTPQVLILSGVTGVASGEIGALFTELLRSTLITGQGLKDLNNEFVTFNQNAYKSKNLGQVSFGLFAEAIKTSGNALAIATARGEEFTTRMTKDLTALAGLASTLNVSISDMNAKFESAGSMLMDADSPFRTFLAISGGANINQMLTNQFDKTDAMLKGVKYLQDFNRSFGGNIALTAQVAEKQLGISRDMAIKMINMRQDAIDDMRKAQSELAAMRNDEADKAYEKVNSDLGSMWARIKMMFSNFFFNALGGSEGMKNLVYKLEAMMGKLKDFMENSQVLQKLGNIIERISNWIGEKLGDVVDWITKKIDAFSDPNSKNPLLALWDTMIETLKGQAMKIGMLIGAGMLVMSNPITAALAGLYMLASGGSEDSKEGSSNNNSSMLDSLRASTRPHEENIRNIEKQQRELKQWNPETVTYGKNASGGVGFMTVGQKEYALEQKKEQEQKELKRIQLSIEANTGELVKQGRDKNSKSNNLPRTTVEPSSPLAKWGISADASEDMYKYDGGGIGT